jgi:hypothetical protein
MAEKQEVINHDERAIPKKDPAATSNIHVGNSNTYEHCGNNPFEPPPVFNKLAGTGAGLGTALGLGDIPTQVEVDR